MLSINQQTSVGEDMEIKKPSCTVDKDANWYSHYEKQYGVSSKIKNGTTLWSSNSNSGYYSKELNTLIKKKFIPYVHFSIIYHSQDMEKSKCPAIDE